MKRTGLRSALTAVLTAVVADAVAETKAYWPLTEGAGASVTETVSGRQSFLGSAAGPDDRDPAWIDGRLCFDGANDCVQVGSGEDFCLREQGTLAAWVKPAPDWDGEGAVLIKPSNWYFVLGHQNRPTLIYYFTDVFSGMRTLTYLRAERVVPAGTWSHVAISFGSRGARFYVNGMPAGVLLFEDEVLVATPRPVRIGCEGENGRPFAGMLAAVTVIDQAWKPDTIVAHMRRTDPRTRSEQNETPAATTTSPASPPANASGILW